MGNNQRDVSIQLIRIVAMFMIIVDHILNYTDFQYASVIVQITNSGVLIFLFISGYLFGQKDINNWKKWFLNRALRICIPVWIFTIIDVIVEQLVYHNFHIKYIFINLFSIQGFVEGTRGGNPLWFITLICICYLITPLLYKFKRIKINKYLVIFLILATIAIQVICAYFTNIGMLYNHKLSWCIIAIGVYAIGYFKGKSLITHSITTKMIISWTFITAISSIAIIILNKKIDNTVLYNDIVVWYGIVIVDFWIVIAIYKIGRLSWTEKCTRLINFFDRISYEFYIVHYLIILVVTVPLKSQIGDIWYIILTIVLSIVGGTVLHYISNPVIKFLKEKIVKG